MNKVTQNMWPLISYKLIMKLCILPNNGTLQAQFRKEDVDQQMMGLWT